MSIFIDTLKRQRTNPTPIWLMRQAGRHLPEYLDIRKQFNDLMDMFLDPPTILEVSMQPIRRYNMDACIVFSDILITPFAAGSNVKFVEGKGPIVKFNEKINYTKIIGLITCLIGVFIIIIKGDVDLLVNLQFTIGDLWMLAAAIGWALYSIYLFYWNSKLKIFERFTLISFFGALSLLPFYIGEEIFYKQTVFIPEFYSWVIFAAISPGIIAFTLYTMAQKKLGASLTGFTLYVFTVYGAIYGYFLFDEKFEIYHLVGTILVFFGIYLAKKINVKKI